jgi:hypothetical protein
MEIKMELKIAENLDPERIYQSIEEGVYRAMWQMITNATDMPCADFYDSIKIAAEKAFSKELD